MKEDLTGIQIVILGFARQGMAFARFAAQSGSLLFFYRKDDVGFCKAQVLAQAIECAAAEHAIGIVGRGSGVVDLFAAVALKQAPKIRLDAAGEDDAAVFDFLPGIVAGDDGRFDDGHAVVTAGSECADPYVEICVWSNKRWSYFSWLEG